MSGSVLIVMDFWEKLVDGLMEGNGTDCMEEIWRMGRNLTDERGSTGSSTGRRSLTGSSTGRTSGF